jgi:hypothetical protein
MNNPNKKYDHVYVILRHDVLIELGETRVSVLKVFVNEEEAKNEIDRLNNLIKKLEILRGGEISSFYSYQIGRIKKGILKADNNSIADECTSMK